MVRFLKAVLGVTVIVFAMSLMSPSLAAPLTIRVGVLKFGTVNWELDVIKAHQLDKDQGFTLEIIPFASKQATATALHGGAVDVIVSDWIWVARQRGASQKFTFVPFSRMVGGLVANKASGIKTLGDLKGKKIGVAGGPVDKSWLLIQALAKKEFGLDLSEAAEIVFAAPPLLTQKLTSGELDGVINFWHYNARLKAAGHSSVLDVSSVLQTMGIDKNVPMVGYVLNEDLLRQDPSAAAKFYAASIAAKKIMNDSDAEWMRLKPLMNAEDEKTFLALRDGFRAGIPSAWRAEQQAQAQKLFQLLKEIGGEKLVGDLVEIPKGTFMPIELN